MLRLFVDVKRSRVGMDRLAGTSLRATGALEQIGGASRACHCLCKRSPFAFAQRSTSIEARVVIRHPTSRSARLRLTARATNHQAGEWQQRARLLRQRLRRARPSKESSSSAYCLVVRAERLSQNFASMFPSKIPIHCVYCPLPSCWRVGAKTATPFFTASVLLVSFRFRYCNCVYEAAR